jgi:hypothetical protein
MCLCFIVTSMWLKNCTCHITMSMISECTSKKFQRVTITIASAVSQRRNNKRHWRFCSDAVITTESVGHGIGNLQKHFPIYKRISLWTWVLLAWTSSI